MATAAHAALARPEIIDGNSLVPPDEIMKGRPTPVQDLTGSPTPDWEGVISEAYKNSMGYAYMVAKDGRTIAYNATRLARSAMETSNPDEKWNPLSTQMNLASVSKPITAVAIMTEVQRQKDKGILTRPFWPVIQPRFPGLTPGQGVDTVTVEDLLTMKSGLVKDDTIFVPSIDEFLRTYLAQPLASGATPGETSAYSNTNFTILQVVYEALSGTSFVEGVKNNVFKPMGIAVDDGEITTVPDDTWEALGYIDQNDPNPGQLWPPIPCVGAGGWLAWPHGALQFLIGVRMKEVLNDDNTDRMLKRRLGWYCRKGRFGNYYHHNGGLVNTRGQWIKTGIVRFEKGYDAILFTNSDVTDPVEVLIDAFDAKKPE